MGSGLYAALVDRCKQMQTDANSAMLWKGEMKDLLYQHSAYKKTPSLALRQNDGAGTEKRPKNKLFQK